MFTMKSHSIINFIFLFIFLIFNNVAFAQYEPWVDIQKNLFLKQKIIEKQNFIKLYVAEKIENAAIVPVSIRLSESIVPHVKILYLIIDRNPDPYAMHISFFDAYKLSPNIGERNISTRIRINDFSKVRVILETDDEKFYMDEKFVAGAGGCSASPSINIQEALNNIGEIRVKTNIDNNFEEKRKDVLIMIRHPNFTGMQKLRDDEQEFIPARYVKEISINEGRDELMMIESGISLSENPVFRFSYGSNKEKKLQVKITDSENAIFNN